MCYYVGVQGGGMYEVDVENDPPGFVGVFIDVCKHFAAHSFVRQYAHSFILLFKSFATLLIHLK